MKGDKGDRAATEEYGLRMIWSNMVAIYVGYTADQQISSFSL